MLDAVEAERASFSIYLSFYAIRYCCLIGVELSKKQNDVSLSESFENILRQIDRVLEIHHTDHLSHGDYIKPFGDDTR